MRLIVTETESSMQFAAGCRGRRLRSRFLGLAPTRVIRWFVAMNIIPSRNQCRAAAVTLAALWFSTLAPSLAGAGIADAVKTRTLSNGIRVLVLENHKAPVATFNVFYHVGSRNEQF